MMCNMQKQQIEMKTIEERAKECTYRRADVLIGTTLASIFEKGYIVGATEQKNIDESIGLKKCNNMTKGELKRETAFLEQYVDEKDNIPSFSDAIEWARKEVIKEANDWFSNYLTIELRDSVNWFYGSSNMKSGQDRFIEAMEEQL